MKQKDLFLNSIALDRKAAYSFLLDLASWMIILFIGFAYVQNVDSAINNLPKAPILDPEINSAEQLQTIASQMGNSINSIYSNFFLSLILIFISLNFFKASIYSILLRKNINMKIFGKYLLMKFIWLAIWLIPIFTLFLFLKQSVFYFLLAILFILYLHFTFILNLEFFKDYNPRIIKKVLKKNFRYCPRFIAPETLIVVIFIIFSQLYWIYKSLPDITTSIISGLIFITLVAWTRIYLIKVFQN